MNSHQSSHQPVTQALLSGRWVGRFLTGALILSALPSYSEPLLQEVDLKGDHQQMNKLLIERVAECTKLERQFNQYDLYRSATGSKTYGVDLYGRVWTMKREQGKACSLQTQYRLNKPDYELDYLGKRIWSAFHYEDPQLCLYTRQPNQKTSRTCFQRVGIVSKLAPYFTH